MNKKRLIVCWAALSATAITCGIQVEWISSTEATPWHRMPAPALQEAAPDLPPDVSVQPDRTYQVVEGFGGCFNELGWVALSHASRDDRQQVLRSLFSADGCDFNLARIPIGASDFALDGYSLDDSADDYALRDFSIQRDRRHLIPFIQAARQVRPDLKCWASPWSPPAWMKTNRSYSKGSLRWEPDILRTYASYFARWIEAYRAEGIDLYAVTPQNEPNILNVYPTCLWTGPQLREFIADYLAPTLQQKGIAIDLWLGLNGDPFNGGDNINDRLLTVMTDRVASHLVSGIGLQYDSRDQIAVAHQLCPDQRLIQTESKCFDGANSWAQAEELFDLLQRYFDGGASQYFAWNMVLDDTGMSSWHWRQNALISVDHSSGQVTYNGEYYVYRHFSGYVKPGARRVLSTGTGSNRIAFQNRDGSIVLLMRNPSDQGQDIRIAFAGLPLAATIAVKLPAHSINTWRLSDRPAASTDGSGDSHPARPL